MTKITSEHLARSAYVYIRQSTADRERCLAKIPKARVCKRAPPPPLLALGRDAGSIAGRFTAKAELVALAKTGGPPQTGETT
jgi:hypothetical protein